MVRPQNLTVFSDSIFLTLLGVIIFQGQLSAVLLQKLNFTVSCINEIAPFLVQVNFASVDIPSFLCVSLLCDLLAFSFGEFTIWLLYWFFLLHIKYIIWLLYYTINWQAFSSPNHTVSVFLLGYAFLHSMWFFSMGKTVKCKILICPYEKGEPPDIHTVTYCLNARSSIQELVRGN